MLFISRRKTARIREILQLEVLASLIWPVIFPLLLGCGTKATSPVEASYLHWDEIVGDRQVISPPSNSAAAIVNSSQSEDDVLPWVKQLKIQHPKSYERGVYGKVGNATVYIASTRLVPDDTRLYWIMVKVLSEKYGCFITEKKVNQSAVAIECRDRRKITFKRSRGNGWVMFYGRQYDQNGREIVITAR